MGLILFMLSKSLHYLASPLFLSVTLMCKALGTKVNAHKGFPVSRDDETGTWKITFSLSVISVISNNQPDEMVSLAARDVVPNQQPPLPQKHEL